jgi:flagellar hook-associated protein 2
MTLSTNLVAGLSSGFDWRSMIDQLMKIESRRVDLVGSRKTEYEQKLTEWQSFNTKLLSLKTAASSLSDPESFDAYRSSLSSDNSSVKASDLLSVSTSSSAAKGCYTIIVDSVAVAERLRSVSFESTSEALDVSGEIEINGVAINLNESDTLASIRTKINNAGAGVTASIVSYEEDDHRLTLTSEATGAEGISRDGSADILAALNFEQIAAGRDASVVIDGISITRSTNVIEGVVEEMTFNLLKADSETTLTVNVDRDINAVMEKIGAFVDAYNAVSAYLRQQQSYDREKEEKGGILFGDGTLSSVKSDLTSLLTQQVWGAATDLFTMGLAGIEVDKEGRLSINDGKLRGFLETRFNDIKLLFSVNGTTDAGSLGYVFSSKESQAGEYAVDITQAATRSATTSNTAVSGTLGENQTLTITQDGKTAELSLTSDMTLSAIIHAINTEMAQVGTAKLVGAEALTSGGSSPITSATAWGSIDEANLVNGDVIIFSGTGRTGASVSGSYTISNTETDTVQGLLSAVESAYGGRVTASVDGSGRLVITDKQEGNSQLSLSFDYSGMENQTDIFGAVSTANPGGQEGRWAMNITASQNEENQLVLTHNSFGSSYGFTIQENTDTGLWNGSWTDPVEVNNGLDVAGTINGEAATGSGQILTGNNGEQNVGGLAVRYSGSETGEVGHVTLTVGIAELFDRALFNITDPYAGYVGFKQESLRNSIKGFETRIEQMEARLNKKMEMMINRFVIMETALASIQNQSQWLSGQISSSWNAWGWGGR